jgi:hypothetical protein
MATAELEPKTELQTKDSPFAISPIEFEATKDELRALVAGFAELTVAGVNDKEGIAAAREARIKLKNLRTSIEKRRKELKADSLEYGKRVDGVAKELTAIIEPEEKRLEHEESIVKREQERLAKLAEEQRRAKIQARLRDLQLCGKSYLESDIADLSDEDFAELLKAEQADKQRRDEESAEAERKRKEAEEANRLEREKLAKEKGELERKQAAAEERLKRMQARMELLAQAGFVHQYTGDQLADMLPTDWEEVLETARQQKAKRDRKAAEEQAKLDRQRKEQEEAQAKIDAEKKRLADEAREQERQAELEKAKAEAAEAARVEAERRAEQAAAEAKAAAEAAERERQRIELLKPDHEKLLAVADAISLIDRPDVSPSAQLAADEVDAILDDAAARIREVANKLVRAGEVA